MVPPSSSGQHPSALTWKPFLPFILEEYFGVQGRPCAVFENDTKPRLTPCHCHATFPETRACAAWRAVPACGRHSTFSLESQLVDTSLLFEPLLSHWSTFSDCHGNKNVTRANHLVQTVDGMSEGADLGCSAALTGPRSTRGRLCGPCMNTNHLLSLETAT